MRILKRAHISYGYIDPKNNKGYSERAGEIKVDDCIIIYNTDKKIQTNFNYYNKLHINKNGVEGPLKAIPVYYPKLKKVVYVYYEDIKYNPNNRWREL